MQELFFYLQSEHIPSKWNTRSNMQVLTKIKNPTIKKNKKNNNSNNNNIIINNNNNNNQQQKLSPDIN